MSRLRKANHRQTERMLHHSIAETFRLNTAFVEISKPARELNRAAALLVLADPRQAGELQHTLRGLCKDIQEQATKITQLLEAVHA